MNPNQKFELKKIKWLFCEKDKSVTPCLATKDGERLVALPYGSVIFEIENAAKLEKQPANGYKILNSYSLVDQYLAQTAKMSVEIGDLSGQARAEKIKHLVDEKTPQTKDIAKMAKIVGKIYQAEMSNSVDVIDLQ